MLNYVRIEDLFSGQFWNLAGIVIGISGILYANYSKRKDRKNKLLGFKIKTEEFLNSNNMEELKILFDKKAINNLLITKILIMNEGNDLILSTDIPLKKPITIRNIKKDNHILKFEVLYDTKSGNNISLTKIAQGIHVHFDYFNPNDSCIIQISHSSDNELRSDKNYDSSEIFKLEGEIKGFGSLMPLRPLDINRSTIELSILFPAMFLIIFLLLGITDYFFRNNPEYMEDNIMSATLFGVVTLSLILIFLIYRSIDRFIKNRDLIKNEMLNKL